MRTVPPPRVAFPAPIAAPVKQQQLHPALPFSFAEICPAASSPLPAARLTDDDVSLDAESEVDDVAAALESVRVSEDIPANGNHEMAVHHNRLISYSEQRRPASMVCWIRTWNGSGTGFLARLGSQRVIITNNHVLEQATSARTATVHFDYHNSDSVIRSRTRTVKLDPFAFFFTDVAHDFTVCAYRDENNVLAERSRSAYDLTSYSTALTLPGDSIHVFQHPDGQSFHSSTGKVVRTHQQFVLYDCSTDYGSSGSLLLTRNYELLALHHQRVPLETCNQGVMISCIVGVLLKQLHSYLLVTSSAPLTIGTAASCCGDAGFQATVIELLEEHKAREAQLMNLVERETARRQLLDTAAKVMKAMEAEAARQLKLKEEAAAKQRLAQQQREKEAREQAEKLAEELHQANQHTAQLARQVEQNAALLARQVEEHKAELARQRAAQQREREDKERLLELQAKEKRRQADEDQRVRQREEQRRLLAQQQQAAEHERVRQAAQEALRVQEEKAALLAHQLEEKHQELLRQQQVKVTEVEAARQLRAKEEADVRARAAQEQREKELAEELRQANALLARQAEQHKVEIMQQRAAQQYEKEEKERLLALQAEERKQAEEDQRARRRVEEALALAQRQQAAEQERIRRDAAAAAWAVAQPRYVAPSTGNSRSPASSSGGMRRCKGTTENNTRCTRKFEPQGNQQYCWQH